MTTDSPSDFRPQRVVILGIGLLGGSVALSLRRLEIEVVGYSRTQSTREKAIECGVISTAYDSVASACQGADVVVVASPVDRIASMAIEASMHLSDGAIITDVGSTKAKIVSDVSIDSRAASLMVAAHPIAGPEKTGVENSDAELFDEKSIVVTPTKQNPPEQIDRAMAFWRLTGGRVIQMTPVEHDRQLAAISHVPHLLASLVAGLPDDDSIALVGSGWLDLTRVASGDPSMWTAICEHNAEAISDQLLLVIDRVAKLRERIDRGDVEGLSRWLDEAKKRRDEIDG